MLCACVFLQIFTSYIVEVYYSLYFSLFNCITSYDDTEPTVSLSTVVGCSYSLTLSNNAYGSLPAVRVTKDPGIR